jgi:anti-sigma B factor antagonist
VRPLAHIEIESDGDVPVAHIAGEIDASNVRETGRRLRAAMTNASRALVVDLLKTSYLDSAAMNLLFELAGELGERQQELHVVIGQRAPIARVAEITGLSAVAAIHPSLETARRQAGS